MPDPDAIKTLQFVILLQRQRLRSSARRMLRAWRDASSTCADVAVTATAAAAVSATAGIVVVATKSQPTSQPKTMPSAAVERRGPSTTRLLNQEAHPSLSSSSTLTTPAPLPVRSISLPTPTLPTFRFPDPNITRQVSETLTRKSAIHAASSTVRRLRSLEQDAEVRRAMEFAREEEMEATIDELRCMVAARDKQVRELSTALAVATSASSSVPAASSSSSSSSSPSSSPSSSAVAMVEASPAATSLHLSGAASVDALIARLQLQPHPEGGFYRRVFQSTDSWPPSSLPARFYEKDRGGGDGRSPDDTTTMTRHASTHIYYLLRRGERSMYHRICSDELWHFYGGSSLEVRVLPTPELAARLAASCESEGGTYGITSLHLSAASPFAVAPAGHYFAAHIPDDAGDTGEHGAYALVGCTVAPGFDFADFEMPSRDVLLNKFSKASNVVKKEIIRFTKDTIDADDDDVYADDDDDDGDALGN
jgi:predicted cupin superfamily sugar epimerase